MQIATSTYAVAILLVVLAAVTVLWLRAASKARRRDRPPAASAGAPAETEFRAGIVYQVLAIGAVSLDGVAHYHGVIRDESGNLLPLFTAQPMAHLGPDDHFALVGEKLLPVSVGADAPPPAADAGAEATVLATDDAPATATAGAEPADLPAGDAEPDNEFADLFAAAAPEDDDADKTVLVSLDETAAADPNAGLAYLKVVSGNDSGRNFHLPFARASIGRDESNEVPLADNASSRLHCEIRFQGHRFVLKDNNSTNGTLCNGERIEIHQLHFGDTIRVADTEMRFTCDGFELKDADPQAAIEAFEATLGRQPDFLDALQQLAFLLERSVTRRKDAQPLWDRIGELERSS